MEGCAAVLAAFAVLVFTLAGCGGPLPVTSSGYDQNGCKLYCDHCAPQTLCVGVPYVPACLIQCSVTADCDLGFRCAVITTASAPSVCVAPASLTLCDPPTDCLITTECKDGRTQLKPLPSNFKACGWEVIHCDSGCDSATGSCK